MSKLDFLAVPKPFIVSLRFQSFPVWFIGLNPQLISTIYLPDYTNWSYFQRDSIPNFHNPILLEALLRLTPSKFAFNSVPSSASSLYLYSGSVEFLNSRHDEVSTHVSLFLLDTHCNPRKLPTSALTFSRITHNMVGGMTNYSTLWS